MSSAFQRVLAATGYMTRDGRAAPGLLRRSDPAAMQSRAVFEDVGVGLEADAVFRTQNATLAIFKDATAAEPSDAQVLAWHEAAWNVGVAPLLWIVTPTRVGLYNCYQAPRADGFEPVSRPIGAFGVDDAALEALEAACGRLATETGAFWSSEIGIRIDRQNRVDQVLLAEIAALESLLTALPPADPSEQRQGGAEIQASRDLAQRLIGRCIFSWYLLDRRIVAPFWPKALPTDLAEVFATTERTFALFDWLRASFNGDLFPMDDPGAERARLGSAHLALMRDFVLGRSLAPDLGGQSRLFRFRFDAIPVDLISAIYQQFARSAAEAEAQAQGLHYTPIELVHLTLDPVFEGLSGKARVIDPTCGSGAFLVEAFRRLVWKRAGARRPRRAEIREVLYEQLYGVDINRSALGIAAFSLYLAALELDTDAIEDIADLKFHRLIGRTLFEADALGEDLPDAVTAVAFGAVVGNPPWTFDSAHKAPPRKAKGARPRRSPDQAFLLRAAQLAGAEGRVGMVMKATPFFSREEHAIEARNLLLDSLKPTALVNLSALRREKLFPGAVSPALLFFARCTLMPGPDQVLLGSVPWTPDFRRSGVFHIGPGELRPVPLARILRSPPLLKAASFGGARDVWLIDKLEHSHPTLATFLDAFNFAPGERRGQGFQVHGPSRMQPPESFRVLPVLGADAYGAFRLHTNRLTSFEHKVLHRTRSATLYRGPMLICPKGSFSVAGERGRYSAAVHEGNLLYNESFFGVSFADRDPTWAYVLSGILNSSLTAFQLAFAGGGWGLERSTVEPKDLLSLRVPNLAQVDPHLLKAVVEAEVRAARSATPDALVALDSAVAELYDLDPDEAVLAADSIARARMLVFEGHAQRCEFVRPPSRSALEAYATQVATVINRFLRARGERRLEATVFSRPISHAAWTAGDPGVTAVRFHMVQGPPAGAPIVHLGDGAELEAISRELLGQLDTAHVPYLNERRQMRLYVGGDLFVLKPSEARCWDRAAGLNDADLVLADHWLRGQHAAGA